MFDFGIALVFDFGIDGEELADEFVLTNGRDDKGGIAFQNLSVGESDCQPVV